MKWSKCSIRKNIIYFFLGLIFLMLLADLNIGVESAMKWRRYLCCGNPRVYSQHRVIHDLLFFLCISALKSLAEPTGSTVFFALIYLKIPYKSCNSLHWLYTTALWMYEWMECSVMRTSWNVANVLNEGVKCAVGWKDWGQLFEFFACKNESGNIIDRNEFRFPL